MHLNGQFKLKVSDNSQLGINLMFWNTSIISSKCIEYKRYSNDRNKT